MTDRAVSDVLGYILLFSMIMLIATSAVMLGSSTLTDLRDTEQTNNAAVAFDVLADNIDDHARDGAVGRATEIKVADATLYVGQQEDFIINVTEDTKTTQYFIATEPIIYESRQGSSVTYSNGAIFREDEQGSVMVREPRFRIQKNTTVLPQIGMRGNDNQLSVSGSQSVLIRTEQRTPRMYQNATGDEYEVELMITTTPDRAEAWKTYLESHDALATSCSTANVPDESRTTVTCEYMTKEIYIPYTRLTTEFT